MKVSTKTLTPEQAKDLLKNPKGVSLEDLKLAIRVVAGSWVNQPEKG